MTGLSIQIVVEVPELKCFLQFDNILQMLTLGKMKY